MPKQPSKYNRLLKEFTKLNNKLPEDRKLSIKERRKIIRETLLPKFESTPNYKLRVKAIKSAILKEYDKIPPKEVCDLNYIDASDFAYVEWYGLDETIRELVPDCVYVKVTAGAFGETKIFNTRNYEYGSKGVRDIVEAIRTEAEDASGTFIFSGVRKVRPRKRNDGSPENYYLDFVLYTIDVQGLGTPLGDTTEMVYTLPKTKEVRKTRNKVRNVIEKKIKALKAKKDSRRRAYKTFEKNIKAFQAASKKYKQRPTKNNYAAKLIQFNKTAGLLEKYLEQGKFTQKRYDRELQRILKEF